MEHAPDIGILRGQGGLGMPPPYKIKLRCSKLEVANKQFLRCSKLEIIEYL